MKNNRQRIWIKLAILIIGAGLIKVFSFFGGWVEAAYSTGIYPVISTILRAVTGWVPVSLGDILYAAIIVWLIIRLVILIKIIFQRKGTWRGFWQGLGKTL